MWTFMAITYIDRGRFPGLIQVSHNPTGWELWAENPLATDGLRILGVMALSALNLDGMQKQLRSVGWDKNALRLLAEGKKLLFVKNDPFNSLEKLIDVVTGTDKGLEQVLGIFGWNPGSRSGEEKT